MLPCGRSTTPCRGRAPGSDATLSFGDHPRQKLDPARAAGGDDSRRRRAAGGVLLWRQLAVGVPRRLRLRRRRLHPARRVAAVPDYRLWPEVAFPGVPGGRRRRRSPRRRRAAVPALGADPDRVVLGGAFRRRLHRGDAGAESGTGWRPAGVPEWGIVLGFVGLSRALRFPALPVAHHTQCLLAAYRTRRRPQPIAHVDPNDPPALLIHGAADGTVVPANRPVAGPGASGGGAWRPELQPAGGQGSRRDAAELRRRLSPTAACRRGSACSWRASRGPLADV